jgi:hypothetical protein
MVPAGITAGERQENGSANKYSSGFRAGEEAMNMGKYCKAYPITQFRQFSAWKENGQNARKENDAPRPLTDSEFLYLQENFVVTDGVFLDENVIFDNVTPEWIDFCKNTLKFEVPDYCKPESPKTEA